jgi:hypothetical protein
MKPISLDGIVGDTGYPTKIDALGLHRTHTVGMRGPQRGDDECGDEEDVSD